MKQDLAYPPRGRNLANVGEVHETSITKLQKYLDRLAQNKGRLPRLNGRTNKIEIAKACGINRDVLSRNDLAIGILNAFDAKERKWSGVKERDDIGDLQRYLDGLQASRQPIPRSHSGRPNKRAISKACGFHRNVLYNNQRAIELLDAHMTPEGVDESEASSQQVTIKSRQPVCSRTPV